METRILYDFENGLIFTFEDQININRKNRILRRLISIEFVHQNYWDLYFKDIDSSSTFFKWKDKEKGGYKGELPLGFELGETNISKLESLLGPLSINDNWRVPYSIEIRPKDLEGLKLTYRRGVSMAGFEKLTVEWIGENLSDAKRIKNYDWESFDLKEHVKIGLIDDRFMSRASIKQLIKRAEQYDGSNPESLKEEFFNTNFTKVVLPNLNLKDYVISSSQYKRMTNVDSIIVSDGIRGREVSFAIDIRDFKLKERLINEYFESFDEFLGLTDDKEKRISKDSYQRKNISAREVRYSVSSSNAVPMYRIYRTDHNLVISVVLPKGSNNWYRDYQNGYNAEWAGGREWVELLGFKMSHPLIKDELDKLMTKYKGSINKNKTYILLSNIGVSMTLENKRFKTISFSKSNRKDFPQQYKGILPYGIDFNYDTEIIKRSNSGSRHGIKVNISEDWITFSLGDNKEAQKEWRDYVKHDQAYHLGKYVPLGPVLPQIDIFNKE